MKKGNNNRGNNFRSQQLFSYVKFSGFLVLISVSLFGFFLPVSGSGDPVHVVPVLVLKFFPLDETGKLDSSIIGGDFSDSDRSLSSIRAKVRRLNSEGVSFIETATKYKGYKNPSAVSSVRPVIRYEIEYLEPVPAASNSGENVPRTNKFAYLNRANICDYVDDRGVRQVWVWMYHNVGVVEPVESNMAMGRNIDDLWNYNGFGDVSNSHRLNDLPICENTYTVYEFNYMRGLGEMTEDFGHQIESLLGYADESLFSKFVGSDGVWGSNINIASSGCGSVHYAPNSETDYDWYNEKRVFSGCEDWKPDGSGTKKIVNCETWGGSDCSVGDGGVAWKKWWMQNIPGKDNGLSYDGTSLRNWWDFFGDFDEALSHDRSLRERFEISDPNNLPSFSGSLTFWVGENSRSVGAVVAYDSDSRDSVTGYSVSGGVDGALFHITSGGVLSLLSAPDFERPDDASTNNYYSLIVTATSGTGSRELSATQTLTVTVTDVNEPPSAPAVPTLSSPSSTSLSVRWFEPYNTGPSITDYDVQYRQGRSGWFTWPHMGTSRSATITGLSGDTTYEVQVRARNAEGVGAWSSAGRITTGAIPNSPSSFSSSSRFSVQENTVNIGAIVAYDSDSQDSVTGYMISGGADSWLFDITASGYLRFVSAPDFEIAGDVGADNQYVLQVIATSGTGSRELSTTRTIIVTVTDVVEIPSAPAVPTLSSPSSTSLSVRWFEPYNTGPVISNYDVQYKESLSSFTSWPHTGASTSATIIGLSGDTTYEVQVRARNAEGVGAWSSAGRVTTSAIPNSFPSFSGSLTFWVGENSRSVGAVVAYDSDSQDSITGYLVSGGADSELFSINASGSLSFYSATDYEKPSDTGRNNVYVLEVTVTSGVGSRQLSATQTLTVTVTDVNEPPSAPAVPTLSSPSSTSLSVRWFEPYNTGPAVNDYNVQYRAGHQWAFSNWPHTGTRTSTTITDLSSNTVYQVRVSAHNAEGTGRWSSTSSFTTGSIVANNPPVFSGSSTFSVEENVQRVGTVFASDSDAEDSVTGYSVSGGADRSLFRINNRGVLSFYSATDYEKPSDTGRNNVYVLEVAVTSGTGVRERSVTEKITVRVSDVNELEAENSTVEDSVVDSGEDSVGQSGNGFFVGVIIYAVIAVIVIILLVGGAIVFIHMRSGGLSYETVEDPHEVGEGYFDSPDDSDGRNSD